MTGRVRAWHIGVLAFTLLAATVAVTVVIQSPRKGLTYCNLANLDELKLAHMLTPASATELLGPPESAYPYSDDFAPGGTRMNWEGRIRYQGVPCTLTLTIDFDENGRWVRTLAGYAHRERDVWTKIGMSLKIW
jgi:hypothetical protein